MPFINTKVNVSISEEQETEIKTALGKQSAVSEEKAKAGLC